MHYHIQQAGPMAHSSSGGWIRIATAVDGERESESAAGKMID
jgi:hypothetical protein